MSADRKNSEPEGLPLHSQELCLDLLAAMNDDEFLPTFERVAGSETVLRGAHFETDTVPSVLTPYVGRNDGLYCFELNTSFRTLPNGNVVPIFLALTSADAGSEIILSPQETHTVITVGGERMLDSPVLFDDSLTSILLGQYGAPQVSRHYVDLFDCIAQKSPLSERFIDFSTTDKGREIGLRFVESETKDDSIHAIEVTELLPVTGTNLQNGLRLTLTEGGVSDTLSVHNLLLARSSIDLKDWQALVEALDPINNTQAVIVPHESETERLRAAIEDAYEIALKTPLN